jgi:hypothetical protein
MVKVLPEPVTPSRVWWVRPSRRPCASAAIAAGRRPVGLELEDVLVAALEADDLG